MITRFLCCLSLLIIATHSLSAANAPSPNATNILRLIGLDPAQVPALLKGKILSNDPGESTDKELAVTLAIFTPSTLDDTVAIIRSGEVLKLNQDILSVGNISIPAEPKNFETLRFDPGERGELAAMLKATAGSQFNFSAAEYAQLAVLRKRLGRKNPGEDPQAAESVLKELRQLLLNRVQQYQARGLQGIVSYQRGRSATAEPANELSSALSADSLPGSEIQKVINLLRTYPNDSPVGMEHQFHWIKQIVEKRPTLVLVHNIFMKQGELALLAQRQFYVGQSYNALQILIGMIPIQGGTLVFYRNRTSTDQVAGFGGAVRRKIGRSMMRSEIIKNFEKVRAQLSKK